MKRILIAMSLGYADRLSWREDLGGTLGAPELQDSDADVARKVAVLARYVRDPSVSHKLHACKRIASHTQVGCRRGQEAHL